MIDLHISEEEATVLEHSLELLLSDVRTEICHTDSGDFREGLKHEKDVLQRVVEQLKEQPH